MDCRAVNALDTELRSPAPGSYEFDAIVSRRLRLHIDRAAAPATKKLWLCCRQ